MTYGNQYHGNQYIGASPQEPVKERDPDGLCNLLSQSMDRASQLNESLAKLNQHMSAVLLPEPPEAVPTTALGGVGIGSLGAISANKSSGTSHAHDCLYSIMLKLEMAERQIRGMAERFRA
jgi:hypothetical protein